MARQVLIANSYLDMKKVMVLGYGVPVPGITGIEKAAKMYGPFSRMRLTASTRQSRSLISVSLSARKEDQGSARILQKVLDKYPNSDVCDDALYQIAYIYMQLGLTSSSQDLSALVLARETFEDFLLQYPSEKAPQARDNLATIGRTEAGNLIDIAKWCDWSKDYKAAIIYYNDVVRKQPRTRTRSWPRHASRSFAASTAMMCSASAQSVPNPERKLRCAAVCKRRWKLPRFPIMMVPPNATLCQTSCRW